MAIQPFLAMTAAEIAGKPKLPERIAWMACHFSPYGPGLSNLPRTLPSGSLLVVDDATPMGRHDPNVIAQQLRACVEKMECSGVLLDFQRPDCEKTASYVQHLTTALPCPVVVSHFYADVCSCPVCLPPVPPSVPLEGYFSHWTGREFWLELSMEGEQVTVTENGASSLMLHSTEFRDTDFFDEQLLCHYRQEIRESEIIFTLYRTWEDLQRMLAAAEDYGVTGAVGLYQEFMVK